MYKYKKSENKSLQSYNLSLTFPGGQTYHNENNEIHYPCTLNEIYMWYILLNEQKKGIFLI